MLKGEETIIGTLIGKKDTDEPVPITDINFVNNSITILVTEYEIETDGMDFYFTTLRNKTNLDKGDTVNVKKCKRGRLSAFLFGDYYYDVVLGEEKYRLNPTL